MYASIVIPVFNEEDTIIDCLSSLALQTRLPDEVIIVDNNCTDKTLPQINSFRRHNPELNIKVVKELKQGIAYAREKGWRKSRGDVIIFADSDEKFLNNWIATGLEYIQQNGVITGMYEFEFQSIIIRKMTTFLIIPLFILWKYFFGWQLSVGGNLFMKRSILEEINGYSNLKNSDVDDIFLAKKL